MCTKKKLGAGGEEEEGYTQKKKSDQAREEDGRTAKDPHSPYVPVLVAR